MFFQATHAKMHVMEMDWDDLRTVLALVRAGTLAAAADRLGVNYTTVARRVSRAEQRLNTRLFDRLADGYHPTEAAFAIARRAEAMELEAQHLNRELAGFEEAVAGPLVVTAPQLLIGSHLCAVFDAFLTQHPRVELTVRATNDLLNLNQREADLAIRIQRAPNEALIGQRLASQQTAAFASADLADRLRSGEETEWGWIGLPHWSRPPEASLRRYPDAKIRLRFDDMGAVIAATQAGMGVARMPVFVGRAHGLQMVPVMPPQPYADIWALSHRDLARVARVRAFRDLLVPFFRKHAQDFTAQSGGA